MRIQFKPWAELAVEKYPEVIHHWLFLSGAAIKQKFISGLTGPHSGRKYASLPNRSSAPGEYPATQHGALMGGTSQETGEDHVKVGSTAKHARFLRGTRKMAPRRMFAEALHEADRPPLGRFAGFRRK
jgi:hypothetical protein